MYFLSFGGIPHVALFGDEALRVASGDPLLDSIEGYGDRTLLGINDGKTLLLRDQKDVVGDPASLQERLGTRQKN